MGGGGDTTKSLDDVKKDLAEQLQNNARDLLKKDFNITDDKSDLTGILKKLAVNRFKQTYKYDFDEDASKVNPPNYLADKRTAAKLCSIVPPINNQITDYLKNGVFHKLDLPTWMEQTAVNDLSNVANGIASDDTEKQWKYRDYQRIYDAQAEDHDTYACNSVLVYCHGTLIEDGSRAELAIIYYVGVYYKSTSGTKAIRDKIQATAYSDAQKLTGGEIPQTALSLKNTLSSYATAQFQSDFGFEYKFDPPDSLRVHNHDIGYIARNSDLHYIPDYTEKEDIATYLKLYVYRGLNIPLDSIENAAIKDTCEQYKAVRTDATTECWKTIRVDKTYIPKDPANNSIRQVGYVMFWHDQKTTESQIPISVTYIYIQTMFYECQNSEQELACELYKKICSDLRRHIEGNKNLDDFADSIQLKEYMSEYTRQEFNKVFKFEYKGTDSTPPQMKSGGRVHPFEGVYHTKSFPIAKEDVEKWMDTEMFTRNSDAFPLFARELAYDDIVKHVLHYSSAEVAEENSWWSTGHAYRRFESTDASKGCDIQGFTLYLYALGDMSIDKVNSTGGEGIHLKKFFLYYLGIYTSYDAPQGSVW